jgi:chromosomal replication initiator protein
MSDNEVQSIWDSLVTTLSSDPRITPQLIGFISLAEPKGILGETLYLEVPNDLTRSMIETRLSQPITDALIELSEFGGPSTFAVVINPTIEQIAQEESEPDWVEEKVREPDPATGPVDRSDVIGLNPKYSFENFVTGGSNRFAHAASFAVAEAPAQAYNPLFIYGSSGLGKTHLLHAIGHYAKHLYPKIKVQYVSSEEFTNSFINSIQNNQTAEFQAHYRDVDILLIDDIQFLQGKDQTQEAFFHTFNTLHDHNKQVVITSDVPPKQLTGFEERMLSRFEWGLLTDIQAPEFETRVAILRKKSQNEQLEIPDEVIEFMAARVSSNIRELEGTLIRVTAYANLNKSGVDIDLVQTVLKDVVPLGTDNTVDPIAIINAAADYYKISVDDIFGSGRQQAVALARQIAMHICREKTDLSLPKIGQIFGNRDHTTVMYATKKVSKLMRERRYIYNQVSEIIDKVERTAR